MFTSLRDQGRRRRSQTYGVSKAARSSKLSLLSALTLASHDSNDSSSTVTQESYKKSSSGSSRRRKSSKKNRSLGHQSSLTMPVSPDRPKKHRNVSKVSVDVFEFLVDESSSAQPSSTKAADDQPAAEAAPTTEHNLAKDVSVEDDDIDHLSKSQFSDSGVSMGESSIHLPTPTESQGERLPSLVEDEHEHIDTEENDDSQKYLPRTKWKWPDIPQATYNRQTQRVKAQASSPERTNLRFPYTPETSEKDFGLPTRSLSGYDLVADRLAKEDLPPLFRRFKKVNYRVLLQLQDEIIEMEEELTGLDMADTRNRSNSDGSMSPASRRLNWQWSQSDLHTHRLQVLGRLYIKLEQYNQAVLIAQKVQCISSSALPSEVEKFRNWLREKQPLSIPESKFLDDDDDLMALRTAPAGGHRLGLDFSMMQCCIATTILIPLVCFKVIHGILNRMIILAALLVVGMGAISSLEKLKSLEHQRLLATCVGVSILAALFL